ncbi:MAG: monooxygenase [Cellvibrionaceae bacterium]|jgi:monooxygenase
MNTEYFDVLIIGAGLSGIGAAYHLQKNCPNKSYAILEGRDDLGGTWDLFRYPGVRSDSDMYTLGYNFKPWEAAKDIADGPSILNYLRETAVENSIDKHIRYGQLVKSAAWSSNKATWTVEVEQKESGQAVQFSCNMLLMCVGYYSYKGGYTPDFKGRERFKGEIIHPQKWPEELDYKNKKVVVIGSGATAVTLIPALAPEVKHVTMLQRSPTYMASRPDIDATAHFLRRFLPRKMAYRLIRWKNVLYGQIVYKKTRTDPESVKTMLLDIVREELGADYDPADIEKHFTPNYNPWDQRLCLVPNGDLFQAIKLGKASVVTDLIDTFIEDGILLGSGEQLEADIIITATGLHAIVLGGIEFTVDDRPVSFPDTFTYKGMMASGVPNLISTFGYINASWTLRSDLIAEYSCRLLNYMDGKGVNQCTPTLRDEELLMSKRPYVEDFSSGYLQRVMHLFPRQGDHAPWVAPQNYAIDKKLIRRGPIDDGVLVFEKVKLGTEAFQDESIAAD